MKKRLITLLALALCLTGCGVSNNTQSSSSTICWSEPPAYTWSVTEDITISLAQESFPAGTESFTLTFTNTGDQVMLYGEEYLFQHNDGSGWKTPETIENYAFNAIGLLLLPGATQTMEVSPWMLKEPMTTGRWRIAGCTLRVADGENDLSFGGNHKEYDRYLLEFDLG